MRERSLYFSFWLVTVARVSSTMVTGDPDLWGHVLYGLEHLSTGALARTDPYSYTAYGAQWINHEWLCELLFGLGWESAGAAGLWFLRLVLTGAILGIVLLLTAATTRGVWAGLLIYILAILEILQGFSIRPQLFSYFFFSCFLFLIHRIYLQRQTSPWMVLSFTPLMALWANLHGGFLMGIGLLGWLTITVFLGRVFGKETPKTFLLTLFGALLACFATLINPYGVGLWEWLVRSLSVSRAEFITEWSPALRVQSQLTMAGFYATAATAVLLFVKTRERRGLFEWGLLAALCFLGFANNRNGVFFGIAAVVLLPRHLESLFPRLAAPRGFHRSFLGGVFAAAVLFAVGIHFLPGHRPRSFFVKAHDHPVNTYRFIRQNGLKGNVAVSFNWCQSAIWYLGDTCKVAFDGRLRTVYPLEVEKDYIRFHRQDSQWANLVDRYDTQMVLMPEHWPGAERLLQRGDWVVASRAGGGRSGEGEEPSGEKAILLVRKGYFPEFEVFLAGGELVPLGNRRMFLFGEPL